MRKVFLTLAVVALLAGASSAFADGGNVNYTATSSTVGGNFVFTFSEPSTITSLITFTTVDFSQGSTNLVLPGSEVEFFSLSDSGLFNVYFTYSGLNYEVEFFGAQGYSGSGSPYTLLTGVFPVTGGEVYVDNEEIGTLSGGSVNAVAAPEPASLGMLGFGLIGLAALRRKLA